MQKHFYLKTWLRISLLVGVVGTLALVALADTNAGTTFATGSGTGGLELKIDSRTIYNGVLQPKLSWALKKLQPWCDRFFNFDDIKPGDTGETTISLHVAKNPAFICLDFQNLVDKDNGNNEPEAKKDQNGTTTGEMSKELEFFAWRDDGDNVFEVGEKPLFGTSTQSASVVLKGATYALADATHGPAYAKDSTHYIGITWCAGNITVNLATAQITCDGGAMGNEAQTDSMAFDVSFRAVSSKEQPAFLCTGNRDHHGEDDKDTDKKDGHNGEVKGDHDEKGGSGHSDDTNTNNWHDKKDVVTSIKNYCVTVWNHVTKRTHS